MIRFLLIVRARGESNGCICEVKIDILPKVYAGGRLLGTWGGIQNLSSRQYSTDVGCICVILQTYFVHQAVK